MQPPCRPQRRIAFHLATLALAALGSGCASLDSAATRSADVAPLAPSREEQVFRYQSRVADALLDVYPLLDTLTAADPALVDAEQRMTRACGPLTEAVVARLEGREPSLALRWRVFTTTDNCERAAQRIERLLHHHDAVQGITTI